MWGAGPPATWAFAIFLASDMRFLRLFPGEFGGFAILPSRSVDPAQLEMYTRAKLFRADARPPERPTAGPPDSPIAVGLSGGPRSGVAGKNVSFSPRHKVLCI